MPGCDDVGDFGGGAGNNFGVARELLPGKPVEALQLSGGRTGLRIDGHEQVGIDQQRGPGSINCGLSRTHLRDDLGGALVDAGGDEDNVGAVGRQLVRQPGVGQCGDGRLPLGRPGHDGGSLDGKEFALEVGVVDLLAVDEAARGLVADHGVVFPAVPEQPQHLDRVGAFPEERGEEFGMLPAGERLTA
jgi:hypothetical protein